MRRKGYHVIYPASGITITRHYADKRNGEMDELITERKSLKERKGWARAGEKRGWTIAQSKGYHAFHRRPEQKLWLKISWTENDDEREFYRLK